LIDLTINQVVRDSAHEQTLMTQKASGTFLNDFSQRWEFLLPDHP
jgi:hypothetical protein